MNFEIKSKKLYIKVNIYHHKNYFMNNNSIEWIKMQIYYKIDGIK